MKKISVLLLGMLCSCAMINKSDDNFVAFGTCNADMPRKTVELLDTKDDGRTIEVVTYHTAKWNGESLGNGHYLRSISIDNSESPVFYDSYGEKVSGDISVYDCDYKNILEQFSLSNGVLDGAVFSTYYDKPTIKNNKLTFYENGNKKTTISQVENIVRVNTFYYNGDAVYKKIRKNADEQPIRDIFFEPLEEGDVAILKCNYYFRPDLGQMNVSSVVITSKDKANLSPLDCPDMITFEKYKEMKESDND